MDLNGELTRLASAISEHFVVGSDIDSDCSDSAIVGVKSSPRLPTDKSGQETHDRLKEALGGSFYHLIFTSSDLPSDPTLVVQYAIQAWQVWCCSQILDGFCFGLPSEAEKLLTDVWESMKREGTSLLFHSRILRSERWTADYFPFPHVQTELQPMSSRWRGLTHEYLRGVLATSTPRSCQLPTPPASPSISALYKSQPNEPLSIRTLRERELFDLNVRGILTILSGVGLEVDHVPLPPAIRRSPIHGAKLSTVVNGSAINATKVVDEFGEALKRIQDQAIELARVTKEGVMSGWFDVTRVPGAVAGPGPNSTPSLPPSLHTWSPLSANTPQKGGRRATVDTPPRRSDHSTGDRRMSDSALGLPPPSFLHTPPPTRSNGRVATHSPNPDRTPTHTPSLSRSPNQSPNRSPSRSPHLNRSPSRSPHLNRSPNLDRPYSPSSSQSYVPQTQPSTYPGLARPGTVKAVVSKFDHNTMENVFRGLAREDGECVVMCTIEFGLDCVRKVVSGEGLGVIFSPIDSPGEFPALDKPEKGASGVESMDRRTLVKSKVLLESVIEILR